MGTPYLMLAIAAILPALAAALLFLLNKYTKFNKLNYCIKQIIYGIIFGGLAILGTHWGIPINGAQVNARDAAVITAGLLFGCPAGIIAGLIGGIERFFAVYWFGIGSFTQIACSVSTILAGITSGVVRKYMFDNESPHASIGLYAGIVIETFHLFMVFVTNAKNYQKAFEVVAACTAPMLIANALGVMLATLIIAILEKGRKYLFNTDFKSLTYKIQLKLGGLVAFAFVLSTLFLYLFQNQVGIQQTNNLLINAVEDTINDVEDKINQDMLSTAYKIKEAYEDATEPYNLADACAINGLDEINIVNAEGIIRDSNNPEFVDFDMSTGDQSIQFLTLLYSDINEMTQEYGPIAKDSNEYRKYVAVTLNNEIGFIQIGYNEMTYTQVLLDSISNITSNTRVSENGCIAILDENNNIISLRKDINKNYVSSTYKEFIDSQDLNELFQAKIGGTEYYCIIQEYMGYKIVSQIPISDANLSRNIAIFVNTFLEIIIFGLVFLMMFMLVKLIVNKRLDKINKSLLDITDGNLDTVVDGGSTTEFKQLSGSVNNMVDALKGYIQEAATRLDKDLALAKSIQSNALPSKFPAYPERDEFDIYALMQTAKEVGGDFYDFYLTHRDTLNFMIADVSGKGIPAAMFMMTAKTELKSLAERDLPVNEIFIEGNNTLCDGNEAGMFVTAWQASCDLKTGRLTFANAGHNPPLIKRANGKFEFLKTRPNIVLATFENISYNLNELELNAGDTIYLYTDGVTESINSNVEQYGEDRLLNALNSKEFNSCEEVCKFILDDLKKFVGEADQFDDITMVCFTYKKEK